MHKIFENTYDDISGIRDGGFVFQAIVSYDMRWSIVNGEAKYDQRWVEGKLHQVDVYPDLKFMEGYATLNYVVLSEVNLFKRKLDLATEYIKMAFSKGYADEMNGIVVANNQPGPITGGIPDVEQPEQWNIDFTDALNKANQQNASQGTNAGEIEGSAQPAQLQQGQAALPAPSNEADSSNLPATTEKPGMPAVVEKPEDAGSENKEDSTDHQVIDVSQRPESVPLTAEQKKAINDKYFKDTDIKITFKADRVVLREISTNSVQTSMPSCTLKLSTGMVDTLDGKPINSWDNFKIYASGAPFDGMIIDNKTVPPISKAIMYDPIEKANDLIFKTILPSIILEFKGDSVKIDTYSNRSAQVGFKAEINFEDIFKEKEATPVIEPKEGEKEEKKEEDKATPEEPTTSLVKKTLD